MGHAKEHLPELWPGARDYGGVCLRFDDTNPEKGRHRYVNSIIDAIRWLGFDWARWARAPGSAAPYQASDYFGFMYRAAEYLIEGRPRLRGRTKRRRNARQPRRLSKPGVDSRSAAAPGREPGAFREMRDGKHADGAWCCAPKSTWPRPNINLRDPAIYRIKHAEHHNTGDQWCVYPMYTFAHPIEDALEQITHSICTLEFEDQRPFYDWLLDRLS